MADPKRFCGNDNFEVSDSLRNQLRNQPTDERINTLFGHLENAPLDTVPNYITDLFDGTNLCNDLVKHGRKEDLLHLLELVNATPGRDSALDHIFEALLLEEPVYSKALKQLVSSIYSLGRPSDMCIDYIVRKITNNDNDNIAEFLDELKIISGNGYKFNVTTINKLMVYSYENFNLNFHQFVLKNIVNKLSPPELDLVNANILSKFTQRRLSNVKQQRMGLGRKR